MQTFEQLTGEAAIDAYLALLAERPWLAGERPDLSVVTDRGALVEHHERTGDALGLVLRSVYGLTLVDLVESGGVRFPYVRLVSAFGDAQGVSGVVAVARTTDGRIVLIETFRHATGRGHLEIPRGFLVPGEDPLTAAARELSEETGLVGQPRTVLGETFTDTGLSSARVAFVLIDVTGRGRAAPEIAESISGVRIVDLPTMRRMITSGAIDDGFTVQALTLVDNLGGEG